MEKLLKEFNLNKESIDKIKIFKEEFLEYNKKINLTSRKNIENFDLNNIKDSLGIIKFIDFNRYKNILDVGTGGGFPGAMLAILFPNVNFYLNDSNNKKINWLNYIKIKLDLKNVYLINERTEKMEKKDFFNLVVSRATLKTSELIEISANLIKKNGKIIIYKGKNYENELNLNKNLIRNELGLKLEDIKTWKLEKEINRFFIIFKKVDKTKKIYPRNFSKIKSKNIFNNKN